jgi:hypothetical protein
MNIDDNIKITRYTDSDLSDGGDSKIRTASLQRTQLEVPKYFLPIVPIHIGPPREDNLLTKDKGLSQSVLFRIPL